MNAREYTDYVGGHPWEFDHFQMDSHEDGIWRNSIEAEYILWREQRAEEYGNTEFEQELYQKFSDAFLKRKFYEEYIAKHFGVEDFQRGLLHQKYIDNTKTMNRGVKNFMIKSGFLAFLSIMIITAFFVIKAGYKTYDVANANEAKSHIEKIEFENKLLREELIRKENLEEALEKVKAKSDTMEKTLAEVTASNKELEATIDDLRVNVINRLQITQHTPIGRVPKKNYVSDVLPIIVDPPKTPEVVKEPEVPKEVVKPVEKKEVKVVEKKEAVKPIEKKEPAKEKPKVVKKNFKEAIPMATLYQTLRIRKGNGNVSYYNYAMSGNKYNLTTDQVQLVQDCLRTRFNYVPTHVMLALFHTESNFNPNANQKGRFFGIGGIHHSLGRDYSTMVFRKRIPYKKNFVYDSNFNIAISSLYLSDLVISQKGDLIRAIALYYGERDGYEAKMKRIDQYLKAKTGKSLKDYNKLSIKQYNDRHAKKE